MTFPSPEKPYRNVYRFHQGRNPMPIDGKVYHRDFIRCYIDKEAMWRLISELIDKLKQDHEFGTFYLTGELDDGEND